MCLLYKILCDSSNNNGNSSHFEYEVFKLLQQSNSNEIGTIFHDFFHMKHAGVRVVGVGTGNGTMVDAGMLPPDSNESRHHILEVFSFPSMV